MASGDDFWVFGYGSLMWRPGFDFVDRRPALVRGYHRSLCIYSHVHRGTPERPGLVLGLDRGGACQGSAFQVAGDRRDEVLAYLRAREQATSVYLEVWLPVRLDDGRNVQAVAYVVDATHPQYAGRLEPPDLLRYVRQGHGVSGANVDYVQATHEHLMAAGVHDPVLSWLSEALSAPGVTPSGDWPRRSA